MMVDREERIRLRAYGLWEQGGRGGKPEEHWLQAEREVSDNASRVREHVRKVIGKLSGRGKCETRE